MLDAAAPGKRTSEIGAMEFGIFHQFCAPPSGNRKQISSNQ
jgi:hypothetical protein